MITRKLLRDEDLLDPEFRKRVIAEIIAQENVDRKNSALRRHEIYRDQTKKWVLEALIKEFSPETVKQMQNRASNISILRKIVDKLARCYVNGVTRSLHKVVADAEAELGLTPAMPVMPALAASAPSATGIPATSPAVPMGTPAQGALPQAQADTTANGVTAPAADSATEVDETTEVLGDGSDAIDLETQAIQELARLIKLDTAMKKVDRYSELHRNCVLQVIPEVDTVESTDTAKKYRLKCRVLPPFMYDVIEDVNDNEIPRCYILTDFVERNRLVELSITDDSTDGRTRGITPQFQRGNRRDETIADAAEDKGSNVRTFIWWNEKYHFTTDKNGAILPTLSPSDNLNPIQMLPFVNFALDQDGSFWTEGGDDLADGAILVNVLLTDLFTIANTQGWGQLVITGKKLPKVITGGPHNAFVFNYDEGDPEPKVTFASSNPPLDMHMRMVEQYIALLLSTNNLSVSSVQGKLDVATAASGISKMIDQSENTSNIEDKQQFFREKEPQVFAVSAKWKQMLASKNALCEDFNTLPDITNTCVKLKFHPAKPAINEKEKLDALTVRKALGISTMLDLIKLDNPDLTDKEAEAKLLQVTQEKMLNVINAQKAMLNRQAQVKEKGAEGTGYANEDAPPGSAAVTASGENASGEPNTNTNTNTVAGV